VDLNLLDQPLHLQKLIGRADRSERVDRVALALLFKNHFLVFDRGIADRDLHEEPVELRLGQRESALVLDGVLRGDDHEWAAHRARDAVDGHLFFGHRLQKGRLRARGGAVDLVGEDELAEDRAGMELEFRFLLVEDGDARDVGGQEVGRALYALEFAAQRDGERVD